MADQKRKNTGNKQPITRHPLFPAIVGLWCGAIAGLVAMALPLAVMERLVTLAHLDSLLPMAAPPLGLTFRVLLASGAVIGAAVLGFALARQLAGGRRKPVKAARKPRRTAKAKAEAAPANAPLAIAEVAETPVVEEAVATEPVAVVAESEKTAAAGISPTVGRRRRIIGAAAAREAAQALEAPAAEAPAPEAPVRSTPPAGILDVSSFDLDDEDYTAERFAVADPFAPLTQDLAEAGDDHALDEEESFPAFLIDDDKEEDEAPAVFAPFALNTAPSSEGSIEAEEPVVPHRLAATRLAGIAPRPGFELLSQVFAQPEAEEETAEVAAARPFDPPFVPAPVAAEAPEAETSIQTPFTAPMGFERAEASAAERIAGSRLDDLSHVELLERLALAITRSHEEQADDTTEVPFAAEAVDAEIEQASEPAIFAPTPLPVPAALRPVSLDDFDDGDDDYSLPGYVPPRHIGLVRSAPASSDGESGTVVPHRAERPVTSAQTEKSLRDALMTLQRMSGAA